MVPKDTSSPCAARAYRFSRNLDSRSSKIARLAQRLPTASRPTVGWAHCLLLYTNLAGVHLDSNKIAAVQAETTHPTQRCCQGGRRPSLVLTFSEVYRAPEDVLTPFGDGSRREAEDGTPGWSQTLRCSCWLGYRTRLVGSDED